MIAEWTAFAAAMIAVVSLTIQQWRLLVATRARERRTANKLTVLHLCRDQGKSLAEIITAYKETNPLKQIDDSEIRKTIWFLSRMYARRIGSREP